MEKQQEFLKELESIDPKMIVYSDETGIDDNEVKMFGWSKINERCRDSKKGNRKTRINITAALHEGKLFAPFLFIGYSTKVTFETYIEKVLIPLLEPGMVLIIDNASFHKSKKITDLVVAAGCRILYLPPYSPEFNPIEHYWTAVKTCVKKAALKIKNDFYEAAVQGVGGMCPA